MATRMQQRRGTSAEWTAHNPILADGEIGFETDTTRIKIGDGVTHWNELTQPYLRRTGGVMTGPITLIPPTEPEHAARLADIVPISDPTDGSIGPYSYLKGTSVKAINTGTMLNWPPLDGGFGTLFTVHVQDLNFAFQILFPVAFTATMYVRTQNGFADSWSAWRTL